MRLRLAALLASVLTGMMLLAIPASAETASPSPSPGPTTLDSPAPVKGPAIRVRLMDQKDVAKGEAGPPVAGVLVRVADDAGAPVGEAESNDMGVAAIAIPGRGDYEVSLDTKTLPEGISLSGSNTLTVTVNLDIGQNVAFPLNQAEIVKTPFSKRLIDSTTGGLKFGLILALAALGLSLIYGLTGLTNFSHGELIVFGALVAYGFNRGLGMPLIFAGILAVILGGVFGWFQDRVLWRPLRSKGTGIIAMMIVSIGLGLALRNIFQYLFGASTRSYSEYAGQRRETYFGAIRLADKELGIVVVAIAVIAITYIALTKSRLGKAMRAVSDNPALAASSGLRVDGVISAVWILGTALSTLSGVLLGINSQVNFMMGYHMLLLIFAAVILGGLGTIWGAIIGSLVIGVVMEVGPLFGVPTSIKEVGPMLILILIVLVRPQGILGKIQRVG